MPLFSMRHVACALVALTCLSLAAGDISAAEKAHEREIEEGIQNIIDAEPDLHLGNSSGKVKCDMSEDNACPLNELHRSEPSLIFPGGKTSCIDTGKKYAFRVYPGDTDKLYLHFQGGGACWDKMTTIYHRGCKSDVAAHPASGLFNKADAKNPFRSYTIVMVVYCSGDVHTGDKAQSYGNIVQRGYWNTKAAIDWAKANLDSKLDSFVIGGCSAGSLGSQVWASTLLKSFDYKHASLFFDSYLPLFPSSTGNTLMNKWGTCDTPLIADMGLGEDCETGKLTVQDLFERAVKEHPTVTFATLNSKADGVQQSDAKVFGMTMGGVSTIFDSESYFTQMNVFLRKLDQYPNFVSFVVGGNMVSQHCFVGGTQVYTATVYGTSRPQGKDAKELFEKEHTSIAEWIGNVVNVHKVVKSDCFGKRKGKPDWSGTSYCDEEQLPKEIRGRWQLDETLARKRAAGVGSTNYTGAMQEKVQAFESKPFAMLLSFRPFTDSANIVFASAAVAMLLFAVVAVRRHRWDILRESCSHAVLGGVSDCRPADSATELE